MSLLSTALILCGAIAVALLLRLLARRLVQRLATLPARLKRRPRRALAIALVVLAALYFVALFSGAMEAFVEQSAVTRFDNVIDQFFAPWRKDPALLYAVIWVTALGAGPALTGVAVTATAFLWIGKRVRLIAPLWVAFIGAQATTWLGKYAIGRERPSFMEAVRAESPSFPSGHATGALAVFGFLAYVIARDLPGGRARFEIVYWLALLIALVGFSRVFLSVHFVTDVLGGYLVGFFWLVAAIAHAERARAASTPA